MPYTYTGYWKIICVRISIKIPMQLLRIDNIVVYAECTHVYNVIMTFYYYVQVHAFVAPAPGQGTYSLYRSRVQARLNRDNIRYNIQHLLGTRIIHTDRAFQAEASSRGTALTSCQHATNKINSAKNTQTRNPNFKQFYYFLSFLRSFFFFSVQETSTHTIHVHIHNNNKPTHTLCLFFAPVRCRRRRSRYQFGNNYCLRNSVHIMLHVYMDR